MWSYDDSRAAVRDALRLSRAMTLKAAVANLGLGGGKGVIMTPAAGGLPSERRHAALLDFGDTVESLEGRYITAEDVGTSSRDMSVIAQRTRHVAGLARSRGGSGDPSPFTALGVEAAILASCERVFAQRSLRDLRVCVVGAGASLLVADVDERKRSLAEQLGARWISPDEALVSDVDVLVPCALGGIFDDETVPQLRCRVVAGAANNQLADDRIAGLLQTHGVLWAPDFVVNAGGIINIAEEVGTYDPASARRRVESIGDTLRTIYDRAEAEHTTPLAAALSLASLRLATRNGHRPRRHATGAG